MARSTMSLLEVETIRKSFTEVWEFFQQARSGTQFVDGALIEFVRVLFRNPEILLWERFWLERNKDLDRQLYGQVKWCNPDLEFGLNIWNRNHFNLFRKAQWPWEEQTRYADWVKPIVYQHQSGQIYVKELSDFHKTFLRDLTPQEFTPIMYKILGLNEAPWDDLVRTGLDPDTKINCDSCKGRFLRMRGIMLDNLLQKPELLTHVTQP